MQQAEAELMKVLQQYLRHPIESGVCAGQIVAYLTDKEELSFDNKACSNLSAPQNQGKRLYNTLMAVFSGNSERQSVGLTLLAIGGLKIKTIEGDPRSITTLQRSDIIHNIADFLLGDHYGTIEHMERVVADVKKICQLRSQYNHNVGFFERNASRDLFRTGERSEMAVLRLLEKAEKKSGGAASTQTASALLNDQSDPLHTVATQIHNAGLHRLENRSPVATLFFSMPGMLRDAIRSTADITNRPGGMGYTQHDTYQSRVLGGP